MRIRGVPVSNEGVRALVATLYADGHDVARELAGRLIRCLDTGVVLVGLDDGEADALLSVLEDPPDGLVELRGKLMRDRQR